MLIRSRPAARPALLAAAALAVAGHLAAPAAVTAQAASPAGSGTPTDSGAPAGSGAPADSGSRGNAENRPPGLVVLQDRVTQRGREVLGIYGRVPDPAQAGLWRVQVWEELLDRVTVATDKIGCSVSGPLRITGTGRRLIIRELNPGGTITPANRLDHLMWWAVCFPEQAGRDPATLGPLARRLGYSGRLPEREQVLVAPGR